ncbi:PIG-L family deacetylase [bacterium]|nr:MAG: PIG-L family deacetylase [bacterium]
MSDFSEGWNGSQSILVILAHPDDPEFFLGATIARWTSAGHRVSYCLLTRGDKGANDPRVDPIELARRRENEQRAAAARLGVTEVRFLDFLDGCLVPSLEARMAVTRVIREIKPDILVTCDPQNLFPSDNNINHPDHRAAGQIVVDAVFPGAGSPMFFPELRDEGLQPHSVKEVWLSLTAQPNTIIDVTEHWSVKLQALHEHVSQIPDYQKLDERQRNRRTPDSTEEHPRYEEKFKRIIFSR